ncbi:L,D-transpeptidase family protein [Desulfuromonas sp. KJ2020]|uniref:L,D-transpeptidase family protein n=1 Tax=Desulfuromonas sp. KJ2020 TaxID=2919173 RepID=UPI0003209A99|nr:L,D-transpeptidase family protein [Desulfuromonas sp. KJ2020]MCP3177044.1 L,D-transpeptidase family protein [Desulfuromonas sp. KJ2020]
MPVRKTLVMLITMLLLLLIAAPVFAMQGHIPLPEGIRADTILVEKAARLLTLYRDGERIKSYRISLGGKPVGPKVRQGDLRTPEGRYRIASRNEQSRFHRALRISYPNTRDLRRAHKMGVSPGSDIMIHGLGDRFAWLGRQHFLADWTEGCIAVTNEEIEEIWRLVPDGAGVLILP